MKKTKAALNATVIGKLEIPEKAYDLRDTRQPGLLIRVRPSGTHSWIVQLGRGRSLTLGQVDELTCEKARELAGIKVGEEKAFRAGLGPDPLAEKRRGKAMTFTSFLDEKYEPWAEAHLKHGAATLTRLRFHFEKLFGAKPLDSVDAFTIERWRTARLRGPEKVAPVTVNRDISDLKACLARAVDWGCMKEHTIRKVKLSKIDRSPQVRYLAPDEEQRLRVALVARDNRRRAEREHANSWRRERQYETLPDFPADGYTDHLTPFTLLALNTGCRRGELLTLDWSDVDMVRGLLTVRGSKAKSGKTRHIPLSTEALSVLKAWGVQESGLVFPGPDGKPMFSLKTAWGALMKDAEIRDFRLHDLRHSFASKLVQKGVDLNTVRELLGHGDLKMTLRYSHLAPDNLAAAIAKLG